MTGRMHAWTGFARHRRNSGVAWTIQPCMLPTLCCFLLCSTGCTATHSTSCAPAVACMHAHAHALTHNPLVSYSAPLHCTTFAHGNTAVQTCPCAEPVSHMPMRFHATSCCVSASRARRACLAHRDTMLRAETLGGASLSSVSSHARRHATPTCRRPGGPCHRSSSLPHRRYLLPRGWAPPPKLCAPEQ